MTRRLPTSDEQPTVPESERGAALLTVLLLVSVIAVIAATSLDRLKIATRLTGNVSQIAQGRADLGLAEDIATAQIVSFLTGAGEGPERVPVWLGQSQSVPIEGGQLQLKISDGGNCFNLNGLVEEIGTTRRYIANSSAIQRFTNLMLLLGIDGNKAPQIAASTADWIDSDSDPLPGGAEDVVYSGSDPRRLPANGMIAHPAELREVLNVDEGSWIKLQPFVCALPDNEMLHLNINSLRTDQSALLSMIDPSILPPQLANSLLANRPQAGYGDIARFLEDPNIPAAARQQLLAQSADIASQWYRVEASVTVDGMKTGEEMLVEAGENGARILWRAGTLD